MEKKQITIEYGAVSSKYSITADNKFDAYAGMILQYGGQAGLIAIYSPEECKKDCWLNFGGDTMGKLDKIFEGGFENYIIKNKAKILEAHKTIKQLI